MAAFEIPLREGAQQLSVALSRQTYNMSLIWRDPHGWFIDIADSDGAKLITGLPLTNGVNLLAQYQHIIKGALVVTTIDNEPPRYIGLGSLTKLYWIGL